MLKYLKNIRIGVRIGIGFSLILLLFALASLFIINRMEFLSDLTKMMYRHPLTVSNAVLRVDGNIVRIHRSMKDVALAKSDAEIDAADKIVNKYEREVYKDFELISERFLGDKKMYENAIKAFEKWKPIRDEVISLRRQGKKDQAAEITKGKGARHVDKLNISMLALNDFAQEKAVHFLNDTINIKATNLSITYMLVIITILFGIIFTTILTRSITQPLSRLMDAVSDMSMGNLDKRSIARSNDEIGQVSKAFNSMADKLKASHKDLEETVLKRTKELAHANKELKKEIAEHMQAQEALRESEERFRAIFEQAAVGVAQIVSKTGRFMHINQKYADIVGFSIEEMECISFQEITHPDDLHEDLDNMQRLLNGEIHEFSMEKRYYHKNGSIVWVNLTVSPMWEIGEEPNYHIAVVEDIAMRKRAEETIKASLQEKEILLKELYHRTKNNMQVISGLLVLQSAYIDDKKLIEIFSETENRIMSMALVHQKLYQSKNLSQIDLKNYIEDLTYALLKSYQVSQDIISLSFEMESTPISIDTAMPCGLIINEILSNVLKHAFPDHRTGEVRITLHSVDGNGIDLRIKDNGVGISQDIDLNNPTSLGLQLIDDIVTRQLRGKLKLDRGNGTEFTIFFKEIAPEIRV